MDSDKKIELQNATTAIFPTMFRYIVLIGLYALIFLKFKKTSLQFILFIISIILNFFTFVFIIRDMSITKRLMKNIYGLYKPGEENSPYHNPYAIFFVLIIILTGLLFICSLGIILAVFDYGKKTTNTFSTFTMTPANTDLLSKFKDTFRTYMVYLSIFSFYIIQAHSEGPTREILFNIGGAILSLVLLATSIYCCVAAVRFLKIKQYHKQLYQ
jgi:hypothetical protein